MAQKQKWHVSYTIGVIVEAGNEDEALNLAALKITDLSVQELWSRLEDSDAYELEE